MVTKHIFYIFHIFKIENNILKPKYLLKKREKA